MIAGLVTKMSSPTSMMLVAEALLELLPAVPVVLGQAVLDRDDREVPHPLLVERDEVLRLEAVPPLAGEEVALAGAQLAARHVEGDRHLARPGGTRRPRSPRPGTRAPRGCSAGSGAKPPSSPTAVTCLAALSRSRSAWNTSTPARSASANVSNPHGTAMNSWMSSELSAWAPPLMRFMHGTGSTRAPRAAEVAVERQAALLRRGAGDAERHREDGVGAEPALVGGARRARSWRGRSPADRARPSPRDASAISPLTFSTACSTPLPR